MFVGHLFRLGVNYLLVTFVGCLIKRKSYLLKPKLCPCLVGIMIMSKSFVAKSMS